MNAETHNEYLTKLGIKLTVKSGAPQNENFPGATGYVCKLRYRSTDMTFPFYMGSAHKSGPDLAGVISCLCSDSQSIDNSDGFADWANSLGYDPDSRKAESIYKQCRRQANQLHTLLGPDYNAVCDRMADY